MEGGKDRTRTQRGSPREAGAKTEPPPAGSPCKQGEPNPCVVPLAKRGEPTEGAIRHSGHAIGSYAARVVVCISRRWNALSA